MKVLVTGAAGFIGAALVKALVGKVVETVGIDNLNSYYDPVLKYDRLADAGIMQAAGSGCGMVKSVKSPLYRFMKMELLNGKRTQQRKTMHRRQLMVKLTCK